jgi:antibiotic biosynthesis monooxygenase (ABM) superfamily enzyme
MKITDKKGTSPVTTIVRHAILPDRMEAFEAWSTRIRTACRTYKGYLGAEIIKPVDSEGGTVTSIFRFDCYANLETWMQSEERLALLEETSDFCADPMEISQYESLEYMFPLDTAGKPPSREKMAAVTFLGLIAPVYFIPKLVIAYITQVPVLVTVTSLAIITPLMVYAIMPILTRIARPWLNR